MPEEASRGFTYFEYLVALEESIGYEPELPWHIGARIRDVHNSLHASGDHTPCPEFDHYGDDRPGQPLVERLTETGNLLGCWNAHRKQFTDGLSLPSNLTAMDLLLYLEKLANMGPIPDPNDGWPPPFWGRVKRLEKKWGYNLEQDYKDYKHPKHECYAENYPAVPIIMRLAMMLRLRGRTYVEHVLPEKEEREDEVRVAFVQTQLEAVFCDDDSLHGLGHSFVVFAAVTTLLVVSVVTQMAWMSWPTDACSTQCLASTQTSAQIYNSSCTKLGCFNYSSILGGTLEC
jgi:hypothetical protein